MIEDCSAREYVLTGTAVDEGILTFDDTTRTFSASTSNSKYANDASYTSFSAIMTVNIAGHEILGTILETVVSFSITISSPCESTTFFDNISIRD